MSLPIYLTQNKDLGLMQTGWAQQLNPVIQNPLTQGILLKNVPLVSGANVINHLLGRKLQGWIVTRIQGAFTLYDTQSSNPMPELTLQLVSSAASQVDLYVF